MTLKWTARFAKIGALLGGCTLAFMYLDPSRGAVDANERLKEIVESSTVISKPFELTLAEVTRVEPASMVERLRVSGEVQPVNRVVLRAKAGGKIRDVGALEGERVRAGDVLVRFETGDLRSTLLQRESDRDAAEAELALAIKTLSRTEQLAAKNIASKEDLEQARGDLAGKTSRVRSLSAQVDIARTALRDADITAPFDGVVASRTVDAGTSVGADAELLTIVHPDVMEAKVLVSTRDIARVAEGQTAKLTIDGLEEQVIEGTVARINPIAESGTRFVPVYLRLPNHDGKLWGGMFATGSIIVNEKDGALVVPALSLRKDDAGDYVLKLKHGYLTRQPVTIGQGWDGDQMVEIADGIADGDTVLTAPLPELKPDVAVILNEAG